MHQVECQKDISNYILPTTGNQIEVLIDKQFYPRTIVEDKGEDLFDVNVYQTEARSFVDA
jgi:hypothetical protein